MMSSIESMRVTTRVNLGRGGFDSVPRSFELSVPTPSKSRIAQSSIMKLNETSMSKLYDLMLMAVKYQCFHAHHPNEDRLS